SAAARLIPSLPPLPDALPVLAQEAQQIAQQGLALGAAVHMGGPRLKKGRGRGVVQSVAGGLVGVLAQRVVIEQDVGPLQADVEQVLVGLDGGADRQSTRLNSSHV